MFSDAILVQIFSDDRLNGIPLEYQSTLINRSLQEKRYLRMCVKDRRSIMYENPYFGNPYLQQNQQRYGTPYQQPVQQMQAQQQPVYNQMQQVPQQIQQPQLIGHIVDSQEMIQASDVPMNAPYALFPKNDLSEIYLKSWTANGTIQTIVFKPVQNQQTENLPSSQSEMKIGLSDDATETFMKRFDELGRKLDELESSMSNSKPKTRSTVKKDGDGE